MQLSYGDTAETIQRMPRPKVQPGKEEVAQSITQGNSNSNSVPRRSMRDTTEHFSSPGVSEPTVCRPCPPAGTLGSVDIAVPAGGRFQYQALGGTPRPQCDSDYTSAVAGGGDVLECAVLTLTDKPGLACWIRATSSK
jgi:hypothetical protein